MSQTDPENIKAARKSHQCDWCGESIDVGKSYARYRYFNRRDAFTVRLHPECLDAMHYAFSLAGPLSSGDEWTPGDWRRGCCCESGQEFCDCGIKKVKQ